MFYDDCSFERVTGCRFIKLYISMFEKWLSVTAMAGGSEQMGNAHACDVSLGARIKNFVSQSGLFVPRMLTVTSKWHTVACHCFYYHFCVNYNKNSGKRL